MRADVIERVLEDPDRRVVARLSVMDDDEPDIEAVRRTASEVVVAVVGRIGRGVLLIGRWNEATVEARRAVGESLARRSNCERRRRPPIWCYRRRGERDRLTVAG